MEVNESDAKQWLTQISKFMKAYKWLADSFVLDFYTRSFWLTLPKCWRDFLPNLTPTQLADLIDPETTRVPTPNGTIPPLSLLSFKATTKLLSIPRTYTDENFKSFLDKLSVESREPSSEFKNLFRRHVKLKKRHEVEQIGKIVSRLSTRTNTKTVYDIGSGLGHLSRYLTYEYGLELKCVDKEQQFGQNATKFDTELESFLAKKQLTTPLPPPPTHENLNLQFDKPQDIFKSTHFGLTGLHSCGNLSPLILHNYANSSAEFVVSLGCCYMKMDDKGFPLSDFTRSLGLSYSYESLEVSCHAIEMYARRLRSGQVRKLITHSYRATLETILAARGVTHAGLRTVPHTEDLTFQEYATRATSNLEIKLQHSDLSSPQIESNLKDWYKVVLFYSLRLMIAPVIESSILLDRTLHLTPSKTYITSCFPTTSPRNLGIISHKT